MKKLKFSVLFVVFSFFFFACANNENETDTEVVTQDTIKANSNVLEVEDEVVIDNFDYAADWESFKKNAKAKNESALLNLCTNNITDIEGLMLLLNQDFVANRMEKSFFGDLEITDKNGQVYLRFYAEDIGMDEFGYEYASAVTLYFLETEKALLLDDYEAAG